MRLENNLSLTSVVASLQVTSANFWPRLVTRKKSRAPLKSSSKGYDYLYCSGTLFDAFLKIGDYAHLC